MTLKPVRNRRSANRRSERGNVFFTLFGAIAIVGVLGAGIMATMRGPLSTMVNVNRRTQAEADMNIASKMVLLEATSDASTAGDCDGDAMVEPLEYKDPGGGDAPAGGGYLPDEVGSNKVDPWGTPYGYCVWDPGADIDMDGCTGDRRLPGNGNPTDATYTVIALISAGPDQQFQTTCSGGASPGMSKTTGSDDMWSTFSYGEAAALGGGLWNIKSTDPTTAEIGKNIEAQGATFTGAVNLGPQSMFLPDQTEAPDGACDDPGDSANFGILRVNTATDPDTVEICDAGTNTWQSVAAGATAVSLWQQNPGDTDEIFYDTDFVAIGKEDPTQALDVVGSIKLSENLMLDAAKSITWGASGNGITENAGNIEIHSGATSEVAVTGTGVGITGATTITSTASSGTTDALVVSNSTPTPVFIVQDDGNVGVGVTDPNDKLDVSGSIDFTEHLKLDGTNFLTDNAVADSIFLGKNAGSLTTTGAANVFVGNAAGAAATDGESNIIIGAGSAAALTEGSYNTLIGQGVGATLVDGDNNILIGAHDTVPVDVPLSDTHDYLNIGNLIYGDLEHHYVGIGTNTLNDALEVNGTIDASVNVHADGDVDADGDVIADGDVRGSDVHASSEIFVDGTKFGPAAECTSAEKLAWDDTAGWTCITDLQGGSGGGAPDLVDVLTEGNDAGNLNADHFNQVGADEFCNEDRTVCFDPTDIAGGTVAVQLSSIDAATADNTIANADWNQIWNWQLTGDEAGFVIGESAASTGGTGGQALMVVGTAANSTALPFGIINRGNAVSFAVADQDSDTTPFIIDAAGNVGIGTLAPFSGWNNVPTAGLVLQNTDPVLGFFDTSGGGAERWAFAAATGGFYFINDTDNAARMMITNDGDIGINDLTPDDGTGGGGQNLRLDVDGATGAAYYCDENGLNCFQASSVAGTGIWQNNAGVIRTVDAAAPWATADFLFGSPQMADDADATHDARMFFDKSKAAFRAGIADDVQWDDGSVGLNSVGLGNTPIASGDNSIALGRATIQGDQSFGAGYQVGTTGDYATVLGANVDANGDYSMAFGLGDGASGPDPVVSGTSSFGIFMGDQSNVDIAANNIMALIGGRFVIDPTGTQTNVSTGIQQLELDVQGDIGAVNYCDEAGNNCFTAAGILTGVTPRLSSLIAANQDNSINNGAWNQTWNWQLTAAETGLAFGENVASTGGASNQYIVSASTLSGSTAIPLFINNVGNGRSFQVNDASGDTTPFVIDAGGNVGVGVPTPTQNLTVAGTIEARDRILLAGGPAYNDNMIYIEEDTPGIVDGSMGFMAAGLGSSGANDGGYFLIRGNSFSQFASQRGNMYFSAGNPSGGGSAEGSLNFWTNETPRIIVTSVGEVGIGDNTPDDGSGSGGQNLLLDVEGPIGGTYYCDADGLNCFTPASVAGTGLWERNGTVVRIKTPPGVYATDDFIFGAAALDDDTESRMFFDKSSGAFRAGSTVNDEWDQAALGDNSAAFGYRTTASGPGSFATGTVTTADGNHSFASGYYTVAHGSGNVALGTQAEALGDNSFAFGLGSPGGGVSPTVSGQQSFGIFMGDQDSVDIAANNIMALLGGRFVIDPTGTQTNVSTGIQQLELDVQGDIGAVNYCDEAGNNCFTAAGILTGVTPRLSSLIAANQDNSINNGAWNQTWNWQLTAAETGLKFGENVASTGGASNQYIVSAETLAASTAIPLFVNNLGNGRSFQVNDVAADTTPFVIDAGGNVGVGTTAPGRKLEAVENTDAEGRVATFRPDGTTVHEGTITVGGNVAGLTGEEYITYQNADSGANAWMAGMDDDETFKISYGTEGELPDAGGLLTILQNGNVGIGTNAPGIYKLNVSGDIYASNFANMYMDPGSSLTWTVGGSSIRGGASPDYLAFATASTDRMTIDDTGNVLIGTGTATTGALLKVGGTGSIMIPVGTNAQRPTGAAGMFRYNTDPATNDRVEYYDAESGTWIQLASSTSASPAAPDRSIQFNNAGVFGGSANLTYTSGGNIELVGGSMKFDTNEGIFSTNINGTNTLLINNGADMFAWLGTGAGAAFRVTDAAGTPKISLYNTGDILLNDGDADHSISMNRAAAGNGNALTLEAGGAHAGDADTDGGSLILSSGISTGNAGSDIVFKISPASQGNGTTDRAPAEMMRIRNNTGVQWQSGSADGYASTAWGTGTNTSNGYATAFGMFTTASGEGSTAFGATTIASGDEATAWGGDYRNGIQGGIASGISSTAFGIEAKAGSGTSGDGAGDYSLAIGLGDSSAADDTEYPKVEGVGSIGLFMGDQKNVNISADNIMALLGGRLVIDPDTTSAANTNVSTGAQQLELDVEGDIGAINYCDQNGNNCFTPASVSGTGIWQNNSGVIRTVDTTAPWASADFVFGSSQLADTGNAAHDSRMFFDKSKSAFRAGNVDAAQWNDANVGDQSAAFGLNTTASAAYSMAWGSNTSAINTNATAFGITTSASEGGATAFGSLTSASGYLSTAFGSGTSAEDTGATAWGLTTTASEEYATAWGQNSTASGDRSTAWGYGSAASGLITTAFGRDTVAGGDYAIAFGQSAEATGANSLAIGLSGDPTFAQSPVVSGDQSFGIFMGNQETVDITASNIMALLGGRLVIDPDTTSAANTNVSTGVQQLELDVEGDIGAVNYCDQNGNNCFTPAGILTGVTPRISSLIAANADNTANNGAWNQTWNWQLTAAETGMKFGENVASTGGASNQYIVSAETLAASTAIPLFVNNLGNGASFRVNDVAADTTPFIIDASGNVAIGKTAAEGMLNTTTANYSDLPLFERMASATTGMYNAARLVATTSADMDDDFGAGLSFMIRDDASVLNEIANLYAVREGADNSGAFVFETFDGGASSEKMRISANGNVGIGTDAPGTIFHIQSAADATATISSELNAYVDINGGSGVTPGDQESGIRFLNTGNLLSDIYVDEGIAGTPLLINGGVTNDVSLAYGGGSALVGTVTPTAGAQLKVAGTGSIMVPVGTNAQRPTGAAGMIRYNTDYATNDRLEYWDAEAGQWTQLAGGTVSNALSSITAAVAGNAINNAAYMQRWNWELTAPGQIGMYFTESAPSSGGSNNQGIVAIATQTGSTAIPLGIVNMGDGVSFAVSDEAAPDATPFVVDASGNVGIGTPTPAAPLHIAVDTGLHDVLAFGDATDPIFKFQVKPDWQAELRWIGPYDKEFMYVGDVSSDSARIGIDAGDAPDGVGFNQTIALIAADGVQIGHNDPQQTDPALIRFWDNDGGATPASIQAYWDSDPNGALEFQTTTTGYATNDNQMVLKGDGSVLIGTDTPTTGALFKVAGTNSIMVPVGTNAQRPTGAAGMIRYNTDYATNDRLEYYDAEAGQWTQLAGGTVSNALSSITAATADNSINNGAWNQVWNWQLTAAETGMKFGENVASTGGASNQYIVSAETLAASTAIPLFVNNLGNGSSFRVNDTAGDTSPFVINASGNVGIGTATPSTILSLNGEAAQTIGMERRGTGNGNNLTIQAGGGELGGTDVEGGDLILASGIPTGNASSNIRFQLPYDWPGPGTTDRGFADFMVLDSYLSSATIGFNNNMGNGYNFTTGYSVDNSGYNSVAFGRTLNVTGGNGAAFGLGNTTLNLSDAANPTLSGDESFAIFMGDQSNVDVSADHILALLGGRMVIDPDDTSATHTNVSTGVQQLELDVEGDIGAVNYCDQNGNNCFTAATAASGGTSALSSISAALADNTINSGAWNQVWNWQLTGAEVGFAFGENTASTGGNGTNQFLVSASTLSGSTATPMVIQNAGNSPSFVVSDQAADGSPFLIDASGNVGVGVAAPLEKLHVQDGNILAMRSGDSEIMAGELNTDLNVSLAWRAGNGAESGRIETRDSALILAPEPNDSLVKIFGSTTAGNTIIPELTLRHEDRNSAGSDGIGTAITFNAETETADTFGEFGRIATLAFDANNASKDGEMRFYQQYGNTLTETMRLNRWGPALPDGSNVQFNAYWDGNTSTANTFMASESAFGISHEGGANDRLNIWAATDGTAGATVTPSGMLSMSDNGSVFISTGPSALDAGARLHVRDGTGTNGSVYEIARFENVDTNSAGADGIGSAITFYNETETADTFNEFARIVGMADDAANNSRDGSLRFFTVGANANSSAAATERMRIDSLGNIYVGHGTTPTGMPNVAVAGSGWTETPKLQLEDGPLVLQGDNSGVPGAMLYALQYNDSASYWPGLVLGKGRGTMGSRTVVQSGHILGELSFAGYDGSGFDISAQIQGVVTAATGAADMPTAMVFTTTPDGSQTPAERMRIDSTGNIGIGNVTTPSYMLSLNGTAARTIGMEQNAAATAGQALTLRAGTAGAGTNVAGGNLTLQAGGSTGNVASNIYFYVPYSSTSGTGTNAAVEGMRLEGASGFTRLVISGDVRTWDNGNIYAGGNGGDNGPTDAAYAFSTDGNTGMWNPAADNLAFSTAGTERIRVGTTGNVGIGDFSGDVIDSKLHIVGSGANLRIDDVAGAQAGCIRYNDTSDVLEFSNDCSIVTPVWTAFGGGSGVALSAITAATGTNTINNANQAQVWNWQKTANGWGMNFSESTASTGGTGNNQYIVGINTLSGSTAVPLAVENAGNSASFWVGDQASDTTPFLIDNTGRVGIGNASPAAMLHVTDGTGTNSSILEVARLENEDTNSAGVDGIGSALTFRTETETNGTFNEFARIAGIATDANNSSRDGALAFYTVGPNANSSAAATEAMRISSAGYVGIGTNAPITNLDVSASYSHMVLRNDDYSTTYLGSDSSYTAVEHSHGMAYSGGINVIQYGGDTPAAFNAAMTNNGGVAGDMFGFMGMAMGGTVWSTDSGNATALSNGAFLPGLAFAGQTNTSAGSGMVVGAAINGRVDGTVSSGNLPTSLIFRTSATDSSGLTERMRIRPNGNIGVGNFSSDTVDSALHLVGSGSAIRFDDVAGAEAGCIRYNDTANVLEYSNDCTAGVPVWTSFGGSSGVALSGITAATGSNTILNGNNDQSWQWQLTSADNVGFEFAESTASTGANTVLAGSRTLPGSTAIPWVVFNEGNANSFEVWDEAKPDTTPFVVDADGKVGIGTGAPSEALHIYDPSAPPHILLESGVDNDPTMIFNSDRTGSQYGLGGFEFHWDGNSVAEVLGYTGADTTNKDEGGLIFSSRGPADSGPVNRMFIAPEGTIGIGTMTPFNGWTQTDFGPGVELEGEDPILGFYDNTGGERWYIEGNTDGFNIVNDTDSNTSRFFIDNDGHVGIGTTTPTMPLHVYNNGISAVQVEGDESESSSLALLTSGDAASAIDDVGATGWAFSAPGDTYPIAAIQNDLMTVSWAGGVATPRMLIEHDTGNIGIGNFIADTVDSALHIQTGDIRLDGGAGNEAGCFRFDDTTTNTLQFSNDCQSGAPTWTTIAGASGSSPFERSGTVIRPNTGVVTLASDDFVFGAQQLDDDGVNRSRFFFDKSQAAFRAGDGYGTEWDSANLGFASAAFGQLVEASGDYSAAFNRENFARGDYSAAFGNQNYVTGTNAFAIGYQNEAEDGNSFVGGNNSFAGGGGGFAYGDHAAVGALGGADYGIAMGAYVSVENHHSMAFGSDVLVSGAYSAGFGLGTATSTAPEISGNNSVGFFLGDQDGVEVSDSNVFTVMGGNVGIGTAAPAKLLHLQSDSGNGILIETTGANTQPTLQLANTGKWWSFMNDGSDSNKLKIIDADNGTRMAIDVAGRVGVGTEAPASTFHVYQDSEWGQLLIEGDAGDTYGSEFQLITQGDGATALGSASTRGWGVTAFGAANGSAAAQNDLSFEFWNGTAWQPRMRIDGGNGYVGVGNFDTDTIDSALHVVGSGSEIRLDDVAGAEAGCIRYNDTSNQLEFSHDCTAGTPTWTAMGSGGGGTSLNSITAATANQTGIDSGAYTVAWNWNSLAGGSALSLNTTSTGATSNSQTMLEVTLNGTNANSTQTTYGMKASNFHNGTNSTNVGLFANAGGGTSANYPVWARTSDNTDSTILTALRVENEDANSAGVDGIGSAITFWNETETNGTFNEFARIAGVASDANNSSRDGELRFYTVGANANSSAAATERMRIDSAGLVGIGSALTPTQNLHISAANPGVRIQNSTFSDMAFSVGSTNASMVANAVNLSFETNGSAGNYVNGTQRMVITNGGNVGIGDFSSDVVDSALHIVGSGSALRLDDVAGSNAGCIRYNDTSNVIEYSNDCTAGTPTWSTFGGGGAFTSLSDVPSSYASQALKYVRVNSGATGLEFTDTVIESVSGQPAPSGILLDDLSDVVITGATNGQGLVYNGTNWVNGTPSASVTLNGIAAATAANTPINNAAYQQEWQWNSLAGGSGLKLSASTTAATGGTQKLFEVTTAGTNGTGGQTTYGGYFTNTHAGGTSTNVGIYASATGGTSANRAIYGTTSGTTANDQGGYFTNTGTGVGNAIVGINSGAGNTGSVADFENTGGGAVANIGVYAVANGTGAAIAVRGEASGTSNTGYGVYGTNASTGGYGVYSVGRLGVAPANVTIASAAGAEYSSGIFTAPQITFTGTTNVTSQMDSFQFTPQTFAGTAATVSNATTMTIEGAPVKGGSVVLTNTHALKINTRAVSTATNSYGLYVDAMTGATNNYAATFATGNVGIGTVAPGAKLHVAQTSTAGNAALEGIRLSHEDTDSAGSNGLGVYTSYVGESASNGVFPEMARVEAVMTDVTNNSKDADLRFYTLGRNAGAGSNTASLAMTLSTNAVTIPTGATTQEPGQANMQTAANGMIRYDSTTNKFRAYENGAWTNMIGGGSASAGGSTTQVQFNNAGALAGDAGLTYDSATDTLAFVSSDGNLSLGENDIKFDGGGDELFYLENTGSSAGRTSFYGGSAEILSVVNAGYVGIMNTTPDVALDVNGDIEYSGTITDVSDIRLKTNINPLFKRGSMLEKLGQINTYSFTMKSDKNNKVEFGVMAQELEKVFPELVRTAKDEMGTKSVNYVGLIAPMIEAGKELEAQNKELKAQLDDMKAQQAEMKEALNTINEDLKGLKVHTGYGISKAQMSLLMLLASLGTLSAVGFARRGRAKKQYISKD